MTNVIEATGLRKRFGKEPALDGLDLIVRQGEVHAFLGPNGAGKTTTIRILLGLLRADGGRGRPCWAAIPGGTRPALHARIAYVPGDVTLWPALTGGEIIDLLARLRGDGSGPRRRRELIEQFDLDPAKKARAYSKGNRQKVALIAALASDAELLLLEEPTAGLDPLMEAVFRAAGRGRAARRPQRAAVQPHPGRGGGAGRPVTIIRAGRTVRPGRWPSSATDPHRRDRAARPVVEPRRPARRARRGA